MKKIIFILFLFFIVFSCYYIYKKTEKKEDYIVSIGDGIANISNTDNIFIDKDYHITDLLNIIKYNQEKEIDNESISIHRLLKEADILIISIGMNDIYYKINDNPKAIYTYLNNIVDNYEEILKQVSKYSYKKVYILGYYNITDKNNDLFTYINYKLKKLADNYTYTYIDLNSIFYNKREYLVKEDDYKLNKEGYKIVKEVLTTH